MSGYNSRLRQLVIERDQGRCVFCGTECLGKDCHVHHIDQKWDEYRNDIDNLVTLCVTCHTIKGVHKTRRDPQNEDLKILFRFVVMLNSTGVML